MCDSVEQVAPSVDALDIGSEVLSIAACVRHDHTKAAASEVDAVQFRTVWLPLRVNRACHSDLCINPYRDRRHPAHTPLRCM